MQNETIGKINGLGKAGYVICRIGRIALTIGAAVCLACAILMCFVPKDAVQIDLYTANSAVIRQDEASPKVFDLEIENGFLEIGENRYQVVTDEMQRPEAVRHTFDLSGLRFILLLGALACAAAAVPLHFGCVLCAHFRACETPFTEAIAGTLTRLAWSLIPLLVVSTAAEAAAHSLLGGGMSVDIRVDLVSVLLIVCVFLLSTIFRYGAALQRDADETL